MCTGPLRAPLGPLQRAKSPSERPQGIQEIPQNCLWCRVWRPDSPFWISAGSCGSVWNKGLFNVFCNVQQALNGPNDSLLFSHLNVTRRNLVNPASLFRADGALWVIVVGLVSLASFCAAETRTLWMMEEGTHAECIYSLDSLVRNKWLRTQIGRICEGNKKLSLCHLSSVMTHDRSFYVSSEQLIYVSQRQ